jgi:predicted Zn-dependent protease
MPGNDIDAVANGTWIQVSTRAAGFTSTPDELAAILAHELAHNALDHRKGKAKIQRGQELAADRLMPWLMARAGYDPAAATSLWRRFKAKRLGGLISDSTHPGWTERLQAVEAERARIALQLSNGGTIVPPDDLRAR